MISFVPEADSPAGRLLRSLGRLLGLRSETVYSRAILLLALLLFIVVGVSVVLVWRTVFHRFEEADEAALLATAQRVKAHLETGEGIGPGTAPELSALLGQSVSLRPADGEASDASGAVALREAPDGSMSAIFTVGDGLGKPVAEVVIAGQNPFYETGELAARIFVAGVAVVGGVMLLLMLVVVDRTILARIQLLSDKVENEKRSERLPVRLDYPGDDELALLARSIEELALLVQAGEREYRNVVEDQTESICRFDAGWSITFSNRAFEAMCLRPPSGRRPLMEDCLDDRTVALLRDALQRPGASSQATSFTHEVARPGEAPAWFRSTLRANYDDAGGFAGGQWVAADVTSEVVAQRKLQESQKQLELLSGRLMHLQDQERRRIARDLHDSTAQSLAALEMNMSVLESLGGNEQVRRLAAETRTISRQVCQELRNISYLLHPPLLEERGLAFAIRWFADGFTKRNSIPVNLDLPEDFPRLDTEAETALFRIVQEAFRNVYRHSGATKVWVKLSREVDGVFLEVRDNGEGLPKDFSLAQSSGVGLAGMRERMKQLGGTLEVVSSPYGVAVQCRLGPDTSA